MVFFLSYKYVYYAKILNGNYKIIKKLNETSRTTIGNCTHAMVSLFLGHKSPWEFSTYCSTSWTAAKSVMEIGIRGNKASICTTHLVEMSVLIS